MSLDRGGQCPDVHAVGANTDRPTAAAGAERQDLVETVEQAGPLLPLDEPFELRPIRGELRSGQPWPQELQGLCLEGVVYLDGLETVAGLVEQVHADTSQGKRKEG